MKRTLQSLVAIGLILGIGLPLWWFIRAGSAPPAAAPPVDLGPVPVEVLRIVPRDVLFDVPVYGILLPRARVTLASELAGRIGRVYPGWRQGALVAAGQELAALDPRPFELALEQSQAAIAEADSGIRAAVIQRRARATARDNARERLDVARREHERRASVVEITSRSAVDKAWDALLLARSAVDEAEAALIAASEAEQGARSRLATAQATEAVARDRLARSRVIAPFDGRLVGRAPSAGAYTLPGAPLGELLDLSTLVLSASVPEDEWSDVRVGQSASVVLAGRPEITRAVPLEAAVSAVSPQVDAGTRSGIVEIELANDSPDRPLAAGLFAEARIQTVTVRGAIVIARRHFRWRDGVPVAFVVVEHERGTVLERRELEFARPCGEGFLVSAGLAAGELLVTRPLDRLSHGQPCVRSGDEPRLRHASPASSGTNGQEL